MRRRPLHMALAMAFLGALVLISIILTAQHFQTRAKIDEFAREAHDAFAAGRYDQAKTWWDKVLTLAPGRPALRCGRGTATSATAASFSGKTGPASTTGPWWPP